MKWFDVSALGPVAFLAWTLVAVLALPRLVNGAGAVAIIALLGGAIVSWGTAAIVDRPPILIMVYAIANIAVALVAAIHSEVLARRRIGYWRFLGPRSD